MSGCSVNVGITKSNRLANSGLSSQNPKGVEPQRWDNNFTLYLSVAIIALITSRARAPYPE